MSGLDDLRVSVGAVAGQLHEVADTLTPAGEPAHTAAALVKLGPLITDMGAQLAAQFRSAP